MFLAFNLTVEDKNFCPSVSAPYIKQCREDDPLLADCIIKAIDHLRPYLKNGKYNIKAPVIIVVFCIRVVRVLNTRFR